MNKILIFVIIMLICLSLGAIGVGVYLYNFRKDPRNKNRDFSVATVSLIMVSSFLVGMLVFGVYYGLTYEHEMTCEQVQAKYSKCNPACPTCIWGAEEQKALAAAESTVHKLQAKAVGIPRNMRFRAQCDDNVCQKEGRMCCGVDADDVVFPETVKKHAAPAAPAGAAAPHVPAATGAAHRPQAPVVRPLKFD